MSFFSVVGSHGLVYNVKKGGGKMARLSQVIGGIPKEHEDECKKCFFCDKDITKGGMWAGRHHIGVCKECSPSLIDFFIDTLDDNEKISPDEKLKKLYEIGKARIEKKDNDNKMLENRSVMMKLGLNYYAEMGIIDFFGLTLSRDEIVARMENEEFEKYSTGYNKVTAEDIDTAILKITEIVKMETNEELHTIRFFGTPSFADLSFDLGCVAKISNNGSTFLFAKDKDLFGFLDRDNGYRPKIIGV